MEREFLLVGNVRGASQHRGSAAVLVHVLDISPGLDVMQCVSVLGLG